MEPEAIIPNGLVALVPFLKAWGVICIVSSSSATTMSSSSDEELPELKSIKLVLPTELDKCFSWFAMVDQNELDAFPGESGTLDVEIEFKGPLRGGIIMPLPPTVGEESGEDCSARVEW